MGVTIKDIAKLANVSHTTVSRALNNSPLINESTKKKIQALAKELNYRPNVSARSLVLHRSYHIGLFFSTLHSGTSANFFYDVVRGVSMQLKDQYHLIVKGIDEERDLTAISRLNFDGILLMSQSERDNDFIKQVQQTGIPQVVLNREVEMNGVGVMNILSDDFSGAYQMVRYLIRQGHTRIAIIEGMPGFYSSAERSKGYLKAMQEHSLDIHESYRQQGNYDMGSGYQAMQKLLRLDARPTAVFCSNDEMAVGAYKAIREHGLDVPGDVSVAGFDDNVFSEFIFPTLTTVRRPIETISRTGAKMLMDLIEDPSMAHEKQYLHTELVIRESVGPVPKKITLKT